MFSFVRVSVHMDIVSIHNKKTLTNTMRYDSVRLSIVVKLLN